MRTPGVGTPPKLSTSFLGWVPQVVGLSEAQVISCAGIDAALYCSFLRMGAPPQQTTSTPPAAAALPLCSAAAAGAAGCWMAPRGAAVFAAHRRERAPLSLPHSTREVRLGRVRCPTRRPPRRAAWETFVVVSLLVLAIILPINITNSTVDALMTAQAAPAQANAFTFWVPPPPPLAPGPAPE